MASRPRWNHSRHGSRPSRPTIHSAVHSRAILGLTAHAVTVECHNDGGLPGTAIVGLPESAVREARDRVKSALLTCGFEYPRSKVVINLAPGDLSKSGTALDLPIALSVLAATGQLSTSHLARFEFLGELELSGALRPVKGALACALATTAAGRKLVVPAANRSEASLAPHGSLLLASDLLEVTRFLRNPEQHPLQAPPPPDHDPEQHGGRLIQIVGQQAAKRALLLAAAGGHHLIMVGPPGTGKTLLARSLVELLPPLDEKSRLEVAAVYSAAGRERADWASAPFRDPHHSASAPALIGGGSPPQPGEAALAHRGVLFLDELPHFKPSVLNQLREPIESGTALIARANHRVTYPCRFQLIAAMNPCPAGRVCREDACRCDAGQVRRYQSRISGPLLDRIDLHVLVAPIPERVLAALREREAQADADQLAWARASVAAARARQLDRQGCLNADLEGAALDAEIARSNPDPDRLAQAVRKFALSARSYHKVWRIARTIADLAGDEAIAEAHFSEALAYRALNWERGIR